MRSLQSPGHARTKFFEIFSISHVLVVCDNDDGLKFLNQLAIEVTEIKLPVWRNKDVRREGRGTTTQVALSPCIFHGGLDVPAVDEAEYQGVKHGRGDACAVN